MKTTESVIVVDYQNTFVPESEGGTGELGVEGAGDLSTYINDLVTNIRARGGVIITTGDYHSKGHMSFASSFIGKKPLTEAFSLGLSVTPEQNPEYFLTYDEVKNWNEQNNGAKTGVMFNYKELQAYLKTVGVQAMWPDHGEKGKKSSELFKDFYSEKDDTHIVKGFIPEQECYSGFKGKTVTERSGKDFFGRNLQQILTDYGVSVNHIVGLATDYCVDATADDSLKNGFKTHIHTQGIAGVNSESSSQKIKELQEKGAKIIE